MEARQQQSRLPIHSVNKRAENFRRVCSKLAKKNNKSPQHYSSLEMIVKKSLEKDLGLIENLHYFHNARVSTINSNGRKVPFWVDFIIPTMNLVIEASPKMFHNLKRKVESDLRKKEYIINNGFIFVALSEKEVESLKDMNIKLLLQEVISRDG